MSLTTRPGTAGTTAPGTLPDERGKPIGAFAGLPLYATGMAPASLRSRSQLERGLGLRLAPGQRPVCYVKPTWHPDERRALYDPAQAATVERSVGAEWAFRARRTCPRCGERREHIVHGAQCGKCWQVGQARLNAISERTCEQCRRVGRKPYPQVAEGWYLKRLCRRCTAKRKRDLDALLAEAVMCPGGCGKKTAAKKAALAWALREHRAVRHWPRVRCAPCGETHRVEQEREAAERRERQAKARAEQEERDRQASEARRQEVADLAAWAREALADPDVVILDTETTGLEDDARIVDIAVVTGVGEVLLDTLVNPGEPIPYEASDIHGITDAMVADAPSFGEILPALTAAVRGRRTLIYNDGFDVGRLRHELGLIDAGPDAWLAAELRAEDVMIQYSDWVGDWSDYWENNRWQRLSGGHRALGDCLAVIECLKVMARPAVDEAEAA